MTKDEWGLLIDIVREKIKDIAKEKEDVPTSFLADYADYEDSVCGLLHSLFVHIKYIKEITYWQDYMDRDKALQYLTVLSAPGIDKPAVECGFKDRLKAS